MSSVPQGIQAAAIAGALVIGFVAGVLVMNSNKPNTWEGCFIDQMGEVHTKIAADVLVRYCRSLYPDSILAGKPGL